MKLAEKVFLIVLLATILVSFFLDVLIYFTQGLYFLGLNDRFFSSDSHEFLGYVFLVSKYASQSYLAISSYFGNNQNISITVFIGNIILGNMKIVSH